MSRPALSAVLAIAGGLARPGLLAADPADPAAPADPAGAPLAGEGEVIVVTGLRLPRPVRDVPAAMIVLDRHELERSPHALADDLVRTLPSAGTFRRSSSLAADPTSQGLNLRGVGPSAVSRALVLRDGVPANDPFGGWIYWRAISPLGIERIEAAPSGASALFGDFALGGVVHVVSRPIARELRAIAAAGSHGTRRAAVRAADRRGELEVAAAVRLDAWQSRAGARSLERAGGERTTVRFPAASELQLDPRLGALARITGALALRASVYRAFRAPTLNELYRPFQVGSVLTAANEALRPETLWGAEAGAQVVVGGVTSRATAFWNRLAGAIANVTLAEPLPDGATRQRQNLGTARVAGLELDASWRPAAAWFVSVAHTFIDADVIAAPALPELVGKRLPQDPRHRATAALAFDDARVATVTAQVRYLGPQFEDDLNTLPIGAVVLVDARAARRLGRGFELFASVQNLFDRRYVVGRAGIDTVGAPRTLELGLAFDAGR